MVSPQELTVQQTQQQRAPVSVLAVEPDPLVRDALELHFAAHPSIALTAVSNVAEARSLLEDRTVEVVVLDLSVEEGGEFLEQLHAQQSPPAIIALYQLAEPDQLQRYERRLINLALTKPLEFNALDLAIAHAAQARRLASDEAHQLRYRAELERLQTQLHQLEEHTSQLQRRLELHQRRFRFAIHDLQNPLANLTLLLRELLQSPEPLPTTARESLQLCVQATDTMRALIEDLLSISQLEHEAPLQYQSIEVMPLLRSVARSFSVAAERKNIWINLLVPEPLPPLVADEQLLRKAVENLVSNAIKYTPYGGSVTIEASIEGETLRIAVRDTGVGLTAEDLSKAFQEFGRLSSVPTAGEPSTGLGLYIVRRIAELHGGSVHAESKGKGQGSTFTLELPLRPLHHTPAAT